MASSSLTCSLTAHKYSPQKAKCARWLSKVVLQSIKRKSPTLTPRQQSTCSSTINISSSRKARKTTTSSSRNNRITSYKLKENSESRKARYFHFQLISRRLPPPDKPGYFLQKFRQGVILSQSKLLSQSQTSLTQTAWLYIHK